MPDTGQSSPITHVFLIVKDGRSFDEIFGDMPSANGDAALCRFPDSITPNHHELARRFVLCDNLFSNARTREEGHQWLMGASITDAVRLRWPAHRGRGVPWMFTGQSALASPAIGYIWDYCEWKRVRLRIYGEFTETRRDSLSFAAHGIEDTFSGMVCQSYPSYDVACSDTVRIARWAAELAVFEQHKVLPGLMVIRLGNDGRASGNAPEAVAAMADNDRALGLLVDRISHSSFWNQSAIFVVEADADGALDHVHPQRVPALVISPYAVRGMVDSTMYSTMSVMKTIERIVGLPSMSQYDESARLMCAPFQNERNDEAYQARTPRVPAAGAVRTTK